MFFFLFCFVFVFVFFLFCFVVFVFVVFFSHFRLSVRKDLTAVCIVCGRGGCGGVGVCVCVSVCQTFGIRFLCCLYLFYVMTDQVNIMRVQYVGVKHH